MATSIRSLNRLRWTQYSKSQDMKQLLGDIIAIFYFWIIEIVVFIIAHHKGEEILSLVVAKLIQKMNRELDTTVIVSSHNLTSINDICGRILLLDKGKVLIDKSHEPGSTNQELEDYFLMPYR